MNTWIRGGEIITPDRQIEDGVIILHDGRIAAIEEQRQVTESPVNTRVIEADGLLVLPGLIDVHVHGGAGSDAMDATPQALDQMSSFFLKHGVTSYLPTTITNSPEATIQAIENVLQYRPSQPGAHPLGLHLEGPYLCRSHRGAQPAEWLRSPDPQEYRAWFDAGGIRLITLAPELPGVLDLIREGAGQGIHFSAGHTEASYEQVRQSADAGLDHATHTFNGMTGLHHREPGAVGAALLDERIFCEVIADGIHVHPAVLRLLARLKGVERTVLVTDAMRAAGLEDGVYDLGGQDITVEGGIARTASGSLAGSTLTLNQAVKNMVQLAGLAIPQAVAMATTTPAASLGLAGQIGSLQPGAQADVILVDEDFQVRLAVIQGEVVFEDQTQP